MHILIIPSEEFVPIYDPLAGIFQYHQAAILKEAGHKVGVISVKQSYSIPMIGKAMIYKGIGKKAGNATDGHSAGSLFSLAYKKIFNPAAFLTAENINGIDVLRIDGFYYSRPSEHRNHFGWLKAGQAAFEIYVDKHGKPDIIHAHNALYAGALARELKKEYNIPYVITEHSTVFARGLVTDKKIVQLVKEAYSLSSRLFGVSTPFCKLLNNLFDTDRFTCLPNVLDPYLEKQPANDSATNGKGFTFLNIAELHPKKDQVTLIKAFKKVTAIRPGIKLQIGGAGELSGELKALVAAESLQSHVTFLGLLNRQQVCDRLRQSDCFVLSSRYETFGVVVIEAMLFGKPVVVTRCGGPEDFVNEETGIIVEKENAEQLADAMLKIIEKYSMYNANVIRNNTISRFGKKAFLETVNTIYKQLV